MALRDWRQLTLHSEAFKEVPVLVVHISGKMVEEVTKAALFVLLGILLIHKLLGTCDLFMQCKTMNASYRYPCFFRIQNGTMHNCLDSAIAQYFHVVSSVDIQCMRELLDHFPAVAAAISNFKALTTCEQDGCRRSSDANSSFVSLGSLKNSEAASRAPSMTD
ncbi:hypothetical protein EJB05_31490, partial [Eragrostis curvula]